MANDTTSACPPPHSREEQEFRDKRQHHSFMGALYGALGGAAFIGLLGTIVSELVKTAAKAGSTVAQALPNTGPEISIFSALPMAVIGGLMAVGTLFVYLAQKEYTELHCIGDEHLARLQAKQLQKSAPAPQLVVEHEQNCRADGKKWSSVVRPGAQPALQTQV